MKILQIIPSMEKGGAERYCADICTELSKRKGIEVMLVSMSDKNRYEFITKNLNYRVCNSKVFPSVSGKNIIDVEEYKTILEEFKPDIIHSHLFWAELLSREVYVPGVKYVTHCQNNMPEFRNLNLKDIVKKATWTTWWEKKWIIKKYRQCKNNFLVISKDTEAYYYKSLPADLHRIKLLYHAIDFERFNKVNSDRTKTLDEIKIIYVARFAVYKNHTFLVDIVNAIKKQGRKVSLHFLGSGEHFDEVKLKVSQLRLEKEITFAGVIDHVEDYLKNANFYVHPAYYEPFGLVIIEAMAAGLPVICLDGKGNRDLIKQGENGYMFDVQDAELFANKIIEIANTPREYERLVENGVNYASGFDIKSHVDELLKYYSSL